MHLIRRNIYVTAMPRKFIQRNFNLREKHLMFNKTCSDLLIFITGMSTMSLILFKCIGTQNALRVTHSFTLRLINQFSNEPDINK
jgi:hypothetical protein